ncbi:MAG: ABC transporter permease [Flavobacteriales bacterium]|nr:ABC transporter permease [Flavobacteriales bacterium]
MLPDFFIRFVSFRYLFSKKSVNIINVITGISILAILVVTAALIILLSAFNGLEQTVKNIFNVFDPHLRVEPKQGKSIIVSKDQLSVIKSWPGVAAVSLTIEENVLAIYKDKQQIVTLKGVDNNYFLQVPIASMISAGSLNDWSENSNQAIIGEGLAANLQINLADFTHAIQVYFPKRGKVDMLNPFREASLIPNAIFSVQHEYTNFLILAPLEFVANLTGYKKEGEVNSLEISLTQEKHLSNVRKKLQQLLGDKVQIKNRFEQHELMYRVMRAEKLAVFLIVMLVLIIASFNIVSALTMLLVEKQKDILVMWSMGAGLNRIKRIYVWEGMWVTIIGVTGGMILGTLIAFLQMQFGWVKLGAYEGANAYPVKFVWTDFPIIFISVNLIGFLASWLRMKSVNLLRPQYMTLIK